MTERDVVSMFIKTGAWITNGHFAYASGRHGTIYVNKYALYPHAQIVSELCKDIAVQFINDNIEVVVAPAMGGIILSQWTAFHLSELAGKEVLATYAEKSNGADFFVLNHGYGRIVEGKRVLIVEDILTSGSSVLKVVKLAGLFGSNIIGVGALWNRGGVLCENLGFVPKLFSLVNVKIDSWQQSDCSLCKDGIPLSEKP